MTALLPSIAIVEVLEGGHAFRYRLVGSLIAEIAGRNATGQMLDGDLYGPDLSRMLVPYRRVARDGLPVMTRSPVLFADTWRASDNLFVPFTTDGGTVDQIMVSVWLGDGVAGSRDQGGEIAVVQDD